MEGLARIPKDRIAVLIGRKGATRKALEDATNSKLHIDSTSGDVSVIWDDEFDPIIRMKFPDVIRAIGRGMNPERALQLLKDDQHLILHDMREYVGKIPISSEGFEVDLSVEMVAFGNSSKSILGQRLSSMAPQW